MDFARTMLEKAGDFYPFGATISSSGNIGSVGGYNGEEHPKPQEIYQLLSSGFAAGAKSGEHLCTALAANVNIPSQFAPVSPDGIRVHIESEGYARYIYVPYKITSTGLFKKKRAVELGEPFAVEINPTFFSGAAR
jgi:hypothetical protein